MFLHASVVVADDNDHGAVILVLITVTRGTKNSEEHAVGEVLVAVLHALMGPDDELEVVASAELFDPFRSESVCAVSSGTDVSRGGSGGAFAGVGPEGIQNYFIDFSELIEINRLWRDNDGFFDAHEV